MSSRVERLILAVKREGTLTVRDAAEVGALLDAQAPGSCTRTGWGRMWRVEVEGEGELTLCVQLGEESGVARWSGDRRVVELEREEMARPVRPAPRTSNGGRQIAGELLAGLAQRQGARG